MLIYFLFMVELFCTDPIDSLDEVIYWVNAISRVLEFMVALCVVAYGTWESLFGEWSWMGASVIIVHSYFNVWLRAQSGWKSFVASDVTVIWSVVSMPTITYIAPKWALMPHMVPSFASS